MPVAITSTIILFRRSIQSSCIIAALMITCTVVFSPSANAQFKGYSLSRSNTYLLEEAISQRTSENVDGNRDSYSTDWKRALALNVLDILPQEGYSLSLVEDMNGFLEGDSVIGDQSIAEENGYQISFDMSPAGNILRVRVPQMHLEMEQESDSLLAQEISQSTSEYYKSDLDELLHIYPGKPLQRGAVWTKTIHRSNPFSVSITLELKLESETDSSYVISIHGRTYSPEEIVFGRDDAIYRFINIDVLVYGKYTVDRQTGWFINGLQTISILSELSVPEELGSDTNIPLTVTEERRLTGRVIPLK